MFLFLFLLSVTVGVVLFVGLLGHDAWLIKGLKEDRVGAIIATCFVVVCAILLVILLRFLLHLIPDLFATASTGANRHLPAESTKVVPVWDIILWFLFFCTPILSGFLLYVLYRTMHSVIKKFALRCYRLKS